MGYVYILSNAYNNVLYTGVTSNLERRIYEHKTGKGGAFTEKYRCHKLVYFEEMDDIAVAIDFEKKIKSGSRKKKERLIKSKNPEWLDLSSEWFDL